MSVFPMSCGALCSHVDFTKGFPLTITVYCSSHSFWLGTPSSSKDGVILNEATSVSSWRPIFFPALVRRHGERSPDSSPIVPRQTDTVCDHALVSSARLSLSSSNTLITPLTLIFHFARPPPRLYQYSISGVALIDMRRRRRQKRGGNNLD